MKKFKFLLLLFLIILLRESFSASDVCQKVDKLRKDAEKLVLEQAKMGYNSWVYGKESNQDAIYKKYSHLFTFKNINLVEKCLNSEKDKDREKALKFFKLYLLSEYIGKKIAKIGDIVENMSSSAKIDVEGKKIPFRQINFYLANEKEKIIREKLYTSCDSFLEKLNFYLKEEKEITERETKKLGYKSYIEMCEDLKITKFYPLKLQVQKYLKDTEKIYQELLEEVVREYLKIDVSQFRRYDVLRLFKNEDFEKYFPKEKLIEIVKNTYREMGFEFKNIKIDTEDREKKNPRAVCFSIVVPDDIRLSIKPIGGVEDYSSLLHEIGHAMHFANTQEKIWEFQQLGPNATTETYAMLSEYLLSDKYYLKDNFNMEEEILKKFLRFQAFERLYMTRRYAAKFLYELKLYSGVKNPEDEYIRIVWKEGLKITPIPSDKKRYLTDVDGDFYVVDYLKAWFLEAMLREKSILII
jgi:oligoendopeptidase F